MKLLYKRAVKKQILDNIGSASNTISEIKKCLVPVHDIYWCNELELELDDKDLKHFDTFQKNYFKIIGHFNDLNEIYHANIKLCQDYPKLEEFSQTFFMKMLYSIDTTITTDISGLKSLKTYYHDKKIRHMVKLLKNIQSNLEEIIENNKKEAIEEKGV